MLTWFETVCSLPRFNVATLDRSCKALAFGEVPAEISSGVLVSEVMLSFRYSGVCTQIWYGIPVTGSDQKFGLTWKLPLSDTFMSVAICCSVRPSSAARCRSTWTKNSGASVICCTWTSTAPRTSRSLLAIAWATCRSLPAWRPLTCTSICDGTPKSRIWVMMSAASK